MNPLFVTVALLPLAVSGGKVDEAAGAPACPIPEETADLSHAAQPEPVCVSIPASHISVSVCSYARVCVCTRTDMCRFCVCVFEVQIGD